MVAGTGNFFNFQDQIRRKMNGWDDNFSESTGILNLAFFIIHMGGLLIPDLHLLLSRSVEEEALDRGKLTLVPIGGRRGGSHEISSYRWCSSAAYGGSYDVVDSWDHFRIGILCRRMSFLSFGYYSDEILRHFSTNIFPQVFRQMVGGLL